MGFELDGSPLIGAPSLLNPEEALDELSAPKGEPAKPASAPKPEAANADDDVCGALLASPPITASELGVRFALPPPRLANGEVADVLANPLVGGIFGTQPSMSINQISSVPHNSR